MKKIHETKEVMEAVAGFSEQTVRELSAARGEPEWMLERRLAAWRLFEEMPWPQPTDEAWRRTRLGSFSLDNYRPYAQRRRHRRNRGRADPE